MKLDEQRTFNALTREPESQSVGELNQAVRDLREMLYDKQLKIQELQELKEPIVFNSKAERRRALLLFTNNNTWDAMARENRELKEQVNNLKTLINEINKEWQD